jgi:hypothetical protein
VGEDAELLPGAVGPVVTRGDDVQGELPFEFRDGFLLGTPAADEGVEGGQIQGQVRGDGGVLEVAVVGGEEIELEVLRALVGDVLAVNHHAEPEIPLRNAQVVKEAGDVGGHGEPPLPLSGEWLQRQPAPVTDLDRVGTAPSRQQAQDVAPEERGVHPELQGEPPAERGPQAVDHLAQERHALFGVVHVARPILHPQDVWPVWATWPAAGRSWDPSGDEG